MEGVIDWGSVEPEALDGTTTPPATPEAPAAPIADVPVRTPTPGAIDWDTVQPEEVTSEPEATAPSPVQPANWRDHIPLGLGKLIPDKWVSPTVTPEKIKQWSDETGFSQGEISQYVAAKGGVLDIIGRRRAIEANHTSAEEARDRGELLAWHGLAAHASGPAWDIANNVLTSVAYSKEQALGANFDLLPAVNALDHFSGSPIERALKDKVHDELANNNSAYKTAMDLVYTAPVFSVAGEGLGMAATATGISGVLAPAAAKVTSLATRMGLPEVASKATVGAAVTYSKLATEAGVLQGTLGAAGAPTGHKVEEFIHGFEQGAALAALGTVTGKVLEKGIELTPLNLKLATKTLSNFGEEAAANIRDRIPETQQLMDVGHTGDISELPRDVRELETYANKVGVESTAIDTISRSDEQMAAEGINTDADAELTRKASDRQAKIALVNDGITNFDEMQTRVESKLLSDMDAGRPLPSDHATLDRVAEALDLDQTDISRTARSLNLREEMGFNERLSYNDLPESDQLALRVRAYQDAITDHLQPVDRDNLQLRNEILQMKKSGKPQAFGTLDDLKSFMDKYGDDLKITDSKIRNKSNDIIGEARRSGISPVESPEAIRLAATQRAIQIHANAEIADFASNYLPSFVKQSPRGNVDIGKVMRGIRGESDLAAAAGMEFVPKSIGDTAREAAENGTWKDGAKVLKTWASDIMKGREGGKASDVTMRGYREFVDKVIHDQGNNPEVVKSWFLQHQLNRKMQSLASEYRLANRIPGQTFFDAVTKRALPGHVILDEIERRWKGTGLGEANIEINNGLQKAAQMAGNIMEGANDVGLKSISDAIKSGEVDKHELFKLIEDPEYTVRGNKKSQAATIRAAAEWKRVAEYLLDRARENDMHIDTRQNWIHHTPMAENEIILTIKSKMRELGIEASGDMDPKAFKNQLEMNPEFAKLVDALEFATGVSIKGASDLADAVYELNDSAGVARNIAPQFAGAKARAELSGIPELLLEHDPMKLTEKYVRQMTQTALLTEPLAHLKAVADALDVIGMDSYKRTSSAEGRRSSKMTIAAADAAYIRDFMGAVAGAPKPGFMAEKLTNQLSRQRAIKLAERWAGSPTMFDRAMKAPGYVGEIITNALYSAMLLRPSSLYKHVMQPVLAMAEEVGHSFAPAMALNSSLKAVGVFAKSLLGERLGDSEGLRAFKLMKERGMFPEHVDDISRGAEGGMTGIIGKVSDTAKAEGKLAAAAELSRYYARFMTAPRMLTEKVNRLGVLIFADDVFSAVKSGAMTSEQAFGKMSSPGMKAELMSAGKNLTDEHLNIYENYLNQKGHYVYNSPQKAQVIRDVGPMMGAFLRYGSEVTGTIFNRIRSGNLSGTMEQMARQAVWLTLATKYVESLGERNDRFREVSKDILGASGFTHLHPGIIASSYVTAGVIPFLKQDYSMALLSNMLGVATLNRKDTEQFTKTLLEALPGTRIGEILMDQIYTHGIRGKAEAPIGDWIKSVEKGVGGKVDWLREHMGMHVKPTGK